MEHLQVTYRIAAGDEEIEKRAHAVLLEQSVETPQEVALRHPFVRENMMGSIESIRQVAPGAFLVTLSLPVITASVDAAQFLNVLYGNSSLHEDVQLEDVTLPSSLLQRFNGPRFGIDGLRSLVNVYDRPLTCSALKPVGLSLDEMADLCYQFAGGGIDLIKDDHYWGEHPFCPFEERIMACQRAVERASAQTGRRCIYVPNLSGTPDQVKRQADFAQQRGVGAVLMAPMLLGMPFLYELTHKHLHVPLIAHPSFAGSLRIRPGVLLGSLFRLFGVDASIFPNYGGRFSYTKNTCAEIADRLRAPWPPLRAAFPAPAGGMELERVNELFRFFGKDTILLIGGSLLQAGEKLRDQTKAFVTMVEDASKAPDAP